MSEDVRLQSSVGVIGAGIQGLCISLCLIKKGFKENDNICISSKKNIFSYAIIIACLKLGISYTFLDRQSPIERIKKF